MQARLKIAAVAFLGLLAGWQVSVGFRQTRSNFTTFPTRSQPNPTVDCGPNVSVVSLSIRRANVAALRAWYVPPRNGATIVLLHGTGADGASLTGDFCMYAHADFGVLGYDGPGYGQSGGRIGWGEGERQAFYAATRWLREQPGQRGMRIGAVGYSAGGFILACAAARDTDVDAIVLAGAPASMRDQVLREVGGPGSLKAIGALLAFAMFHDASGGDPQAVDCVSRIGPRPLLVIAGQHDPVVGPGVAEGLFRHARPPAEMWVVPGARHVDYLSAAGDVYRSHMLRFFWNALLPTPARSANLAGGTPSP